MIVDGESELHEKNDGQDADVGVSESAKRCQERTDCREDAAADEVMVASPGNASVVGEETDGAPPRGRGGGRRGRRWREKGERKGRGKTDGKGDEKRRQGGPPSRVSAEPPARSTGGPVLWGKSSAKDRCTALPEE